MSRLASLEIDITRLKSSLDPRPPPWRTPFPPHNLQHPTAPKRRCPTKAYLLVRDDAEDGEFSQAIVRPWSPIGPLQPHVTTASR